MRAQGFSQTLIVDLEGTLVARVWDVSRVWVIRDSVIARAVEAQTHNLYSSPLLAIPQRKHGYRLVKRPFADELLMAATQVREAAR